MMARAFGVRRTFARTVVGAKVSPRGTTSGLGAVLRTGELRDDAEIHTAGHRSPRPRGRCDQTLSALAVVQHDFACEFRAYICRFAVCTRSIGKVPTTATHTSFEKNRQRQSIHTLRYARGSDAARDRGARSRSARAASSRARRRRNVSRAIACRRALPLALARPTAQTTTQNESMAEEPHDEPAPAG